MYKRSYLFTRLLEPNEKEKRKKGNNKNLNWKDCIINKKNCYAMPRTNGSWNGLRGRYHSIPKKSIDMVKTDGRVTRVERCDSKSLTKKKNKFVKEVMFWGSIWRWILDCVMCNSWNNAFGQGVPRSNKQFKDIQQQRRDLVINCHQKSLLTFQRYDRCIVQ